MHPPFRQLRISASENGPTVVPKCGFDRRGVRSNPHFWSHFAALLLRFTTLLATAARPFVKSGASPSNSPHFCCSFAQFRTRGRNFREVLCRLAAIGCHVVQFRIGFAKFCCNWFSSAPVVLCFACVLLPRATVLTRFAVRCSTCCGVAQFCYKLIEQVKLQETNQETNQRTTQQESIRKPIRKHKETIGNHNKPTKHQK